MLWFTAASDVRRDFRLAALVSYALVMLPVLLKRLNREHRKYNISLFWRTCCFSFSYVPHEALIKGLAFNSSLQQRCNQGGHHQKELGAVVSQGKVI